MNTILEEARAEIGFAIELTSTNEVERKLEIFINQFRILLDKYGEDLLSGNYFGVTINTDNLPLNILYGRKGEINEKYLKEQPQRLNSNLEQLKAFVERKLDDESIQVELKNIIANFDEYYPNLDEDRKKILLDYYKHLLSSPNNLEKNSESSRNLKNWFQDLSVVLEVLANSAALYKFVKELLK